MKSSAIMLILHSNWAIPLRKIVQRVEEQGERLFKEVLKHDNYNNQ